MPDLNVIRTPPQFCQCATGRCDQVFASSPAYAVFLYPGEPAVISATIENAVQLLQYLEKGSAWRTWRDFAVAGQTIFCSICQEIRFADVIFADVTTLNFNLLFEIGFATGIGQAVVPIRDSTYQVHKAEFDELGLLDTIGYLDFQNSEQLANQILTSRPFLPLAPITTTPNSEQPLYVVKGHLATEGELRLMSILKKSAVRFRTYDVIETPRLSLHEARKQVGSSEAVVAHLLSPERQGSTVHNARCALIAGMATAMGKAVLLIQEGRAKQPIDYRDVVSWYNRPDQLAPVVEPFIRQVVERLFSQREIAVASPERKLDRLDLGDVAAENEISALQSYFVRTAQFNDARRGAARLLVGRKGAGKTAIFYAVRHNIPRTPAYLVLDLKPEGYQFAKLREFVLEKLSAGYQEHTLMAFWEYLLLCELAQKIQDEDYTWAQRDSERTKRYEAIRKLYAQQPAADAGDFSERLLQHVEELSRRFEATEVDRLAATGQITELLFRTNIKDLGAVLAPYLEEKEQVWILIDNLDKGWPTRGSTGADIMILRTLLEASRKLQRQLEQRHVPCHMLICLRNDIYEHLVRETSDRGKDTAILLDWDDTELFREIVAQRIRVSTDSSGVFDDVWPQYFSTHVGARDSFGYFLERTLMRPRDLLNFLHRATEVAINRHHERVQEDDITTAEEAYSEDMLMALAFELRDINPVFKDLLYVFLNAPIALEPEEVAVLISYAKIPDDQVQEVIALLAWFGFLGVQEGAMYDPTYSYNVRYNLEKLLWPIKSGHGRFVIHPAFRSALHSS